MAEWDTDPAGVFDSIGELDTVIVSELESPLTFEGRDCSKSWIPLWTVAGSEDIESVDSLDVSDSVGVFGSLGEIGNVDVCEGVSGSGGRSASRGIRDLSFSDSTASDSIAASDSLTMRCSIVL